MLAETSGLTSSEFASVLARSGTTGAEGESTGNSWKFSHLVEVISTQRCDAALAARDAKARKSETVAAAVDNFDLSGLSEAASRIENAISWIDADEQINEYEDDDDEYFEVDVDWYTGDWDDELDDIAYTLGTQTDDPEFLEQFDGNLEDTGASASQVYASASRSFQEAHEFLSRVKIARGYFLVAGTGAFDGLAQPSTDGQNAKSCGKGKKGKRRGKSSSQKGGKPTSLGTPGILPKPQTSRFESRPPMSKKRPTEAGATRGGAHHAPRLRPDQCMLCRQVGHCLFIWKMCVWHLCTGLCSVRFSVLWCNCRRNRTRSRRGGYRRLCCVFNQESAGFGILDSGATKTVSGFMSVQPVADQYKGTTIETTDVGFTFAGGETEAASTRI